MTNSQNQTDQSHIGEKEKQKTLTGIVSVQEKHKGTNPRRQRDGSQSCPKGKRTPSPPTVTAQFHVPKAKGNKKKMTEVQYGYMKNDFDLYYRKVGSWLDQNEPTHDEVVVLAKNVVNNLFLRKFLKKEHLLEINVEIAASPKRSCSAGGHTPGTSRILEKEHLLDINPEIATSTKRLRSDGGHSPETPRGSEKRSKSQSRSRKDQYDVKTCLKYDEDGARLAGQGGVNEDLLIENAELKNDITRLTKQLNSKQAGVSVKDYNGLSEAFTMLQIENEELKSKFYNRDCKRLRQEQEIERLKKMEKEKDSLQIDNDRLKNQINQLQLQWDKLKSDEEHEKAISDEVMKLKEQKFRLDNDKLLMKQEILLLQERVKSADEFRHSNEVLRSEVESLKASIRGLQSDYRLLEEKCKSETTSRISREDLSSRYKEDCDRLRKERNAAQHDVVKISREKEELVNRLRTETESLKLEIDRTKNEKSELGVLYKAQLKKEEEKVNRLEKQNEILQQRNEDQSREITKQRHSSLDTTIALVGIQEQLSGVISQTSCNLPKQFLEEETKQCETKANEIYQQSCEVITALESQPAIRRLDIIKTLSDRTKKDAIPSNEKNKTGFQGFKLSKPRRLDLMGEDNESRVHNKDSPFDKNSRSRENQEQMQSSGPVIKGDDSNSTGNSPMAMTKSETHTTVYNISTNTVTIQNNCVVKHNESENILSIDQCDQEKPMITDK